MEEGDARQNESCPTEQPTWCGECGRKRWHEVSPAEQTEANRRLWDVSMLAINRVAESIEAEHRHLASPPPPS